MRIHITHGPSKPTLREGDLRTTKKGKYVRRQVRVGGCYLVSGGRPVYEWLRYADAPAEHSGRPVIDYCGYTRESSEALKIAVKVNDR